MSDEEKKKRLPLPFDLPELPDPLEIIEEFETAVDEVETVVTDLDSKAKEIDQKARGVDRKFTRPPSISKLLKTKPKPSTPESGRSFEGQSTESYCLECVEGHTMESSTEVGHAIDRFRTAGKMTDGVTEKVKAAIGKLQGIKEDVKGLEGATPEVEKGLNEILDEVRWIRKEFGISGRGLTRGFGTMEDLEELRSRIQAMQNKAYVLVEKCPSCQPRARAMRKAFEEKMKSGRET